MVVYFPGSCATMYALCVLSIIGQGMYFLLNCLVGDYFTLTCLPALTRVGIGKIYNSCVVSFIKLTY